VVPEFPEELVSVRIFGTRTATLSRILDYVIPPRAEAHHLRLGYSAFDYTLLENGLRVQSKDVDPRTHMSVRMPGLRRRTSKDAPIAQVREVLVQHYSRHETDRRAHRC
jgi:hypothetical protein